MGAKEKEKTAYPPPAKVKLEFTERDQAEDRVIKYRLVELEDPKGDVGKILKLAKETMGCD